MEDEGDEPFSKLYDGGVYFTSPTVILAGDEEEVTVAWSMPADDTANANAAGTGRVVYVATAAFTSMNNAANRTGRARRGASLIDQPTLTRFHVQVLRSAAGKQA